LFNKITRYHYIFCNLIC